MGQYDFSAQRVHHAATQLLSASRLKHPPPWYNALSDIPPPQLLVRPAFKAGQHVVEKKPQLPKRLKKGRRPSRMFQPMQIPRGLEHDLRETFFSHHPWELARPRIILENNGRDAEKWDWSRGIKQIGKPLDGESVVQRQIYLRNIKPPHAFASTNTKHQAERTVVIRNLPDGVDAKDIHAFFAECGNIQSLNLYGAREAALEPNDFSELVTDMEAGSESINMEYLESGTYSLTNHVERMKISTKQPESDQLQHSETDQSQNSDPDTSSTIASIRFDTLEQTLAAIQKSGSPIKSSTSPIVVHRLAQPPQTLFIAGLGHHITDTSELVKAFSPIGTISHPHIVRTTTAPHNPTGFGFITFQTPAQATAAKARYADGARRSDVRLYDFPLSHDLCYDIARKEFYAHRHYEDVERKVAQEEARATGAYFSMSPNDIAAELESQKYENWKAWASKEIEKAKQEQGSAMGGPNTDDAEMEASELEQAAPEVAKDVPATKRGQTALGGVPIHP